MTKAQVTFRARLVSSDQQLLLTVLSEALGLQFFPRAGVWQAEMYGGTDLLLSPYLAEPNTYELVVKVDRTNPLFGNQQRTFGKIEQLPGLVQECCRNRGVQCVWLPATEGGA